MIPNEGTGSNPAPTTSEGFESNVGVNHLAMRVAWPGSEPSEALECIEVLGSSVLPAVRAELAA